MSTNHEISLTGDTAAARSYVVAVHVFGEREAARQFEDGSYRTDLRRTSQDWRIRPPLGDHVDYC